MTKDREAILRAAADKWIGRDSDEISIDNDAAFAELDDGSGVWVAAWLYMDKEDVS